MIKQIIFSKSGGGFVFLMEDLVIKQGASQTGTISSTP
jgi:hypothetical protein